MFELPPEWLRLAKHAGIGSYYENGRDLRFSSAKMMARVRHVTRDFESTAGREKCHLAILNNNTKRKNLGGDQQIIKRL